MPYYINKIFILAPTAHFSTYQKICNSDTDSSLCFSKDELLILKVLDVQNYCKGKTELLYTTLPSLFYSLHCQYDTFIIINKPTLKHSIPYYIQISSAFPQSPFPVPDCHLVYTLHLVFVSLGFSWLTAVQISLVFHDMAIRVLKQIFGRMFQPGFGLGL